MSISFHPISGIVVTHVPNSDSSYVLIVKPLAVHSIAPLADLSFFALTLSAGVGLDDDAELFQFRISVKKEEEFVESLSQAIGRQSIFLTALCSVSLTSGHTTLPYLLLSIPLF